MFCIVEGLLLNELTSLQVDELVS